MVSMTSMDCFLRSQVSTTHFWIFSYAIACFVFNFITQFDADKKQPKENSKVKEMDQLRGSTTQASIGHIFWTMGQVQTWIIDH